MSKKIRVYERERGGSEIFLSPRASRRQLGSPHSKIIHNSSVYSNSPYDFMRPRNYGSKILSPNN